jgi:hypothetical protein
MSNDEILMNHLHSRSMVELDKLLDDIDRINESLNPFSDDRDSCIVAIVMRGMAGILHKRRYEAIKLAEAN